MLLRSFFCLVLMMLSSVHGEIYDFEFVNNKDSDGALSKPFIKKLFDVFHPTVFFESGTYLGKTTLNAAEFFNCVITVETYFPLFMQAQDKFRFNHKIRAYHNDSSVVIGRIGKKLRGTILFWLDAHYSGEGTGVTNSANSGSAEAITAIREELAIIHQLGLRDSIILIDDIRGFGSQIGDSLFLGCWAYPTIHEVQDALLKINPNFKIVLLGDALLAYDGLRYSPSFSPTIMACTKTRLYNGLNITDIELIELGKTIQNAPAHEKAFIIQLYNNVHLYSDPMFWHDVWYGLVNKETKDSPIAKAAFQSAFSRSCSAVSPHEAEKIFTSISNLWK